MWNSLARSLLVTCLIHDRWLCEKPWMKRISGPFGFPQSCAEMVRPSGVFTETDLNFGSWARQCEATAARNTTVSASADLLKIVRITILPRLRFEPALKHSMERGN